MNQRLAERERTGSAWNPHADPEFGPGLYVHVPLCRRKCHYCSFTAYVYREARAETFVADLLKEIRLASAAGRPRTTFRTLFFGGGTPSLLAPEAWRRILGELREGFSLADGAETTLEANPEDLTGERVESWLSLGFNRLSIGVQAVQAGLLHRLGRTHGWREVAEGYRLARELGFENVNLDLMFGLPGQSAGDWQAALDKVLDLEPRPPEHLSCYGLEVEEGTLFARWAREGLLPLPDEEREREQYERAAEVLVRAGYEHYEISNFARPGFRCRHNQVYWNFEPYWGLGPGACSFWQGRRTTNHRRLGPYGQAVRRGNLPVEEEDVTDRRTRMAEMLILGTRRAEGLSVRRFREVFGEEPGKEFGPVLQRLAAKGWIRLSPERIALTREGRLLANEVWMSFL